SEYSQRSKEGGSEAVSLAQQESPRPGCVEEPQLPSLEKKQRCRFDGQETKGSKFITSNASDFSDPVYKEIVITNGHINRMSKEELRANLSEFKLETRGVKDVLKKRLKNYYKKQKLMLKESNCADSYYDYIYIIDFEATCEEGNTPPDFIHDIIEFPIVLLNTHTLEIGDTFQQYVRPEINTQLSDFCMNLTGITQDQVDRADTFPQVLKKVIYWMKLKELGTKYKYCILTDGSWDMSKFLNFQWNSEWIMMGGLTQFKCFRMDVNSGSMKEMHAGQLMSVSSSLPVEGTLPPQMPLFNSFHSR
uniref:SAP domain-containing protein n=1 Tax=Microcebus murinus TaxID=30608 RepID=A0A8C5XKP0_MICMU